jgi:tRNA nucleotidyltransferase/poly(A) polymerase
MKQIRDYAFVSVIEELGGSVYSVGGAVRDKILGRKSKDLDILITGIPLTKLAQELQAFGKVSEVGESFGIIKLIIDGEELDIAIPRTERKVGAGHHGFEVNSDHNLSVEDDLIRRDFTINAIAEDADGNLIDPYNGVNDIKNKLLRAVNPDAFIEDPLRMLRAVQFAVRFGFAIEPKTLQMIRENACLIKEVSAERILMEFEKIVNAGPYQCKVAASLLDVTLLYENIFGVEKIFSDVKPDNMAEFIYMLLEGTDIEPDDFYEDMLKGDTQTTKHITAFSMVYFESDNMFEARTALSMACSRTTAILESKNLYGFIRKAANEFIEGLYPKSYKDLGINGDDLLAMGFKGIEIGQILHEVKSGIYMDKFKNNREEIMKYIHENFKHKEGLQ